ncbi:MAG: helix-turn-helix domain-containing protein, partial [Pyrinomonadaceae bacterium]
DGEVKVFMRDWIPENEPMCETSEKNERLYPRDEMISIGLDVGRRIMELFGYQKISNIIFRLKLNSREIAAVINRGVLPSGEMLLCLRRATGVSIDWLLTGEGSKFSDSLQHQGSSLDVVATANWVTDKDPPPVLALQ